LRKFQEFEGIVKFQPDRGKIDAFVRIELTKSLRNRKLY